MSTCFTWCCPARPGTTRCKRPWRQTAAVGYLREGAAATSSNGYSPGMGIGLARWGATRQIWITTAHAARSSSFTDPTRTTLNTMKRFLTLPAELIFGPLVLGISIELLGFLFLILIGQPAFLLSQRLLLAGGAAALLLPSIFLVMAMCSGYQMTRKLS